MIYDNLYTIDIDLACSESLHFILKKLLYLLLILQK